MTINLLSLSVVKDQLGLSDATYDTAITNMIPQVSSDVRRILNTDYNDYIYAGYTNGSNLLNTYNGSDIGYNKKVVSDVELLIGQIVTGDGIPDDTYVNGKNLSTGIFTMSNSATDNGSYITPTISISQWSAISKMIWYRIQSKNITSALDQNVKSKSFGVVSVTYADGEINKQWNYPQVLLNDLGMPYAEIG